MGIPSLLTKLDTTVKYFPSAEMARSFIILSDNVVVVVVMEEEEGMKKEGNGRGNQS